MRVALLGLLMIWGSLSKHSCLFLVDDALLNYGIMLSLISGLIDGFLYHLAEFLYVRMLVFTMLIQKQVRSYSLIPAAQTIRAMTSDMSLYLSFGRMVTMTAC